MCRDVCYLHCMTLRGEWQYSKDNSTHPKVRRLKSLRLMDQRFIIFGGIVYGSGKVLVECLTIICIGMTLLADEMGLEPVRVAQ